jgi:hypothetical protein
MWLRLRWPGAQGGFGGFVALDKNDVDELMRAGIEQSCNALVEYPTSKSMKLLEEYDDGLGEGEEGEAGEVSCSFFRSVLFGGLRIVDSLFESVRSFEYSIQTH